MERDLDDREIRARLAADDPSALEMIWDQYASDLFGYLVSLLGCRHEAEDALQDVFVTIARKRQSVAGAHLFKPYLFRIARNVAMNRLKQRRRNRRPTAEGFDWLTTSVKDEQADERVAQLGSTLAALPEKQRVVIVLKFFCDRTLREIGELMGTSENTAASRYRYGMAALRKLLRES